MKPREYPAKVTDKAELVLSEPMIWRAGLSRLKGKVVVVSVRELKVVRSLQANRRYWCLIVPVVAEVLSQALPEGEMPVSSDEAHEKLKEHFLGYRETLLGKVPKSSKVLDTAQFADYCNRIERWLTEAYGMVLPGPGEDMEVML